MRNVLMAGVVLLAAGVARAEVKEGDKVPDVSVAVVNGDKVPGSKDGRVALAGIHKNVVLFFYPKAMTPGCTVESCGFRDKVADFAKLDTVVIGVSTDETTAQQQFTDKEHLNFPLLADADKSVAKAFGTLNAKGMANRTTYVIDKQGVVRKIYTKVTPAKHPQEVLEYVQSNLAK